VGGPGSARSYISAETLLSGEDDVRVGTGFQVTKPLSEFDIDNAIASLSEEIGATSRSEDELSWYSARLLDRDFHSSSSIAFHAFAPLEAQHACDPIACLSGVHSLTD